MVIFDNYGNTLKIIKLHVRWFCTGCLFAQADVCACSFSTHRMDVGQLESRSWKQPGELSKTVVFYFPQHRMGTINIHPIHFTSLQEASVVKYLRMWKNKMYVESLGLDQVLRGPCWGSHVVLNYFLLCKTNSLSGPQIAKGKGHCMAQGTHQRGRLVFPQLAFKLCLWASQAQLLFTNEKGSETKWLSHHGCTWRTVVDRSKGHLEV